MALDDDIFQGLFDEGRLEHYRDLSERFSLWCGDWRREFQRDPVAARWSAPQRIEATLRAHEAEPGSIRTIGFDSDPSTQHMPSPDFYIEEWLPEVVFEDGTIGSVHNVFPVPGIEPMVFAAWFAAVNYTGQDWSGEAPRALGRPSPRETVGEFAEKLADAFSPRYTKQRPTGFQLFRLRSATLRALSEGAATKESKELKDAWEELGENIGLIPATQGGGFKLPNEFLAELSEELIGLITEVKEWESTDDDLNRVCQLMIDREVPDYVRNLLQEQMRGRDVISRESLERHLKHHDLSAEVWAHALRFPLLDLNEVQTILGHKKVSKTLVREILAGRLPIVPNTLRNRI